MGLGFIVGVLGVLILSHAAYSTIQYRGLLKIMEEEFSGPPTNVVLELIMGIVSLPENLDFMIFNHRGKLFPPKVDLKLKC
ncbi:membrane magnesium transporter [Carica papaya]|uniref:membrane magnesium transporter n=1 Tax=Carica papaya TaxID=3649 RepID=UPI000B8CAE62|nr:membrane magnesium transporter [Carica papaya]